MEQVRRLGVFGGFGEVWVGFFGGLFLWGRRRGLGGCWAASFFCPCFGGVPGQVVSVSLPSSSLLPPVRAAAALAALRAAFVALPPGGVLARVVVVPGAVASLVSFSGAPLRPSSWRLVGSLAGAGGWLLLAPVAPVPAVPLQPALF
jgi:hypothetical protein